MLTWAFYLLVAGALVGLYLAVRHLTGRTPPITHAWVHGPLVAGGLALVVTDLIRNGTFFSGVLAAVLLAGGAMIGVMMYSGHRTGQSPPCLAP